MKFRRAVFSVCGTVLIGVSLTAHAISTEDLLARAFGAVCTPEFFVYGQDRTLAYPGRLDDNWQQPAKVTRRELASAFDALLAGGAPAREQVPAMGCSIKWRRAS